MATERVGKASREIENKNSQIWTIIQKKKILIGTDFGATSLIQKNHTIGENVWKIGMTMFGKRNRKKSIKGKERMF